MSILSFLIFLPMAVALVIALLPKAQIPVFKYIALVTTLVQVIAAGFIYLNFDKLLNGVNLEDQFQFVEKLDWIRLNLGGTSQLEIDYFIGIDGLSVAFLLLTAIVMFIAVIASWGIKENLRGYFVLFLILDMAVMGVFSALDFFLFYIFYELMLLPLYFLIGIWGGVRREYAAIKFFLYTLVGSVFMLLVILGLYFSVQIVC